MGDKYERNVILIYQVYQRKQFKVYKADNSFILHNTELHGFAHTHLDSIKQAKLLIELSLHKRVPNHLSRYLLISLYRINQGEYADKVNELVENKKRKQVYVNRRARP